MQTTSSASNESSSCENSDSGWSVDIERTSRPNVFKHRTPRGQSVLFTRSLLGCSVHETALPPKGRLDHVILADIYTRSRVHLDDFTTIAARGPNDQNVRVLATGDRMATDDLSCNHHCTSAKRASQEIDMHLSKHDETSMLQKSHIHGAGEEVGRVVGPRRIHSLWLRFMTNEAYRIRQGVGR